MKKIIGVIGGGNMGKALISQIHKKFTVLVAEKDSAKAKILKNRFAIQLVDVKQIASTADVVILAVKPQDFDSMLAEIKAALSVKSLIISIAAGITTQYIEKRLGDKVRVVRAMPNLPATIGEGVTAVCKGTEATEKDFSLARSIFSNVGETVTVKEDLMDVITAVSGSGPAYVFYFVECFMNAAKALGLDETTSKELALLTMSGSLHLLESSREEASVLRQQVTSKGGTTQAALEVFSNKKFDQIFKEALEAARNRAKELSK